MEFNPAIPYDLPLLPPKPEIETKAVLKKVAMAGRALAERKTAAAYLRELEKAGILRSHKSGREVLFLNVKLFQLLSK